MNGRMLLKESFRPILLTLFLALSLVFVGCSSDDYDAPNTADSAAVSGAETNVLIEPATLKSWMDEGLVNNDDPFNERVVIIDFGADPTAEHIRNACLVGKSALTGIRKDGLAPHSPLVATGEQMDAVIQSLGIEEDTVIVFTSDSNYNLTRAYWTFRYWGFPKEQLKVVNGGNAGFKDAYPGLMTEEPGEEIEHSNFSVRELGGVKTELRASMGELIGIFDGLDADDSTDVVIDARGDSYYSGDASTSALIADGKVVVDGHPAGGEYLANSEVRNDDNTYKTAEEIRTLFEEKGWGPDKKVTVYCTSAYSATPLFFALDAILDTPVQLHDGSWSQTGLYSDRFDAGGQLPADSPWAIDSFLEVASYNAFIPDPLEIESLLAYDATAAPHPAPFTTDTPDDDSDVNSLANQVEEDDAGVIEAWTGGTVTFDAPVATDTPSVLIDSATLEDWMVDGLLDIEPGSGEERVVLLDVTFRDAYDEGHIPGAQFWNIAGQAVQRAEGPADAVNMVLPPEDIGLPEDPKYIKGMNTRLQEQGIDEYTTIVLTSSDSRTFFPSRAYFTLRYYGWPKDRIKVLDGYNGAWTGTGRVLTKEATVANDDPDLTVTVQEINNHRPDLRVSLPELMDAIRDGRGTPVDFRGDNTATGSTAGVVDPEGDFVVFEGRPKGGMFFPYTQFNIDNAGGDLRYKSAPEIKTALNDAGIFNSEGPIYSYCRTGYIASTGFFVLDGILGWDVMTYDGSWSQWGKLSDNPDVEGELVPDSTTEVKDSVWAVDNSKYMEVINYNVDNTVDVAPLNPDESLLDTDPSDASVNQVEEEDSAYQQEASSGDEGDDSPPSSSDSPALGNC